MDLVDLVDRAACVAEFGNWRDPIIKHADDLLRYTRVIEGTKPEVLVETGTRSGASAQWFASQGLDVISVDIAQWHLDPAERVTWVVGNSVDPRTLKAVARLVAGRRCMVSLDSDHSEDHVRREIELYRELVSPGCYLVVEDAVIDWLSSPKPHGCDIYTGSLHDAIADTMAQDERFTRDAEVERLTPVTMFPAGWWRRD